MIDKIIILICMAIASEALAEIITSSSLFESMRGWWKRWTYPSDVPPPNSYLQAFKVFVDKLLSCGYCSSVWTSGFIALFAPILFDIVYVNWFICTLVIHRLSNWIHVIYELIRKGRVHTYDLLMKQEEVNYGSPGQGESEDGSQIT